MSCSKGTTHLRYRDDEAAALRAAAGRMKARTERAERAAGRAMTGSGGREERNALLRVSTKRVATGEERKKSWEEKASSSFAGPTRESRGNHVLIFDLYSSLFHSRTAAIPHLHLHTHAQTRTPHSSSNHYESQVIRKNVSTHIPRLHPGQSLRSQREHCRCPAGCR